MSEREKVCKALRLTITEIHSRPPGDPRSDEDPAELYIRALALLTQEQASGGNARLCPQCEQENIDDANDPVLIAALREGMAYKGLLRTLGDDSTTEGDEFSFHEHPVTDDQIRKHYASEQEGEPVVRLSFLEHEIALIRGVSNSDDHWNNHEFCRIADIMEKYDLVPKEDSKP